MNGLEALNELKERLSDSDGYVNLFDTLEIETIKKELQALEIIKTLGASKNHLHLIATTENYEEYQKTISKRYDVFKYEMIYPKEEYDLLKEVLS